ncbi:PH domain-containing protein [Saccharopolyspora shandongensis]|uniref:PH domain-containing protein n=1 Tax=Saccharopolyspora shandongensis TaxID=418495 RepID=UPI003419E464
MAYPDGLLGADEHVVVHKHPHWKMLIVPVLVLFVVVGGGSYLAALAAPTDWHVPVWIGLAVLGAVLVVWFTLAPLVRWRTTHFVVTTHRLMVREGVFTRSGIDIPMSRINSVRFRHGLLDRILGCGTLVVESASDEPLEFDDIPQVERVHTLLYREVNDDPRDDWDYRAREGY